jgi:hypothetical protein
MSAGNGIAACISLCIGNHGYVPNLDCSPTDVVQTWHYSTKFYSRLNSPLIANTTLQELKLAYTTAHFSYIGDKLVEVVVSIVDRRRF